MITDMPIQFFGVISTQGEFTPIKFKYQDSDMGVHTVKVTGIISRQRMSVTGRMMLVYRCHTDWEGETIPVELRYDVESHKWTFKRRLDMGF